MKTLIYLRIFGKMKNIRANFVRHPNCFVSDGYAMQGSSTLTRMDVWPKTYFNVFLLTLTLTQH